MASMKSRLQYGAEKNLRKMESFRITWRRCDSMSTSGLFDSIQRWKANLYLVGAIRGFLIVKGFMKGLFISIKTFRLAIFKNWGNMLFYWLQISNDRHMYRRTKYTRIDTRASTFWENDLNLKSKYLITSPTYVLFSTQLSFDFNISIIMMSWSVVA